MLCNPALRPDGRMDAFVLAVRTVANITVGRGAGSGERPRAVDWLGASTQRLDPLFVRAAVG
jgi:hypothetical protein